MRDRGVDVVDVTKDAEDEYAEHCRVADIATAPLRDCLSYYNGHGDAEPGSLAYYGGAAWQQYRIAAQETLAPYEFESRSAHPELPRWSPHVPGTVGTRRVSHASGAVLGPLDERLALGEAPAAVVAAVAVEVADVHHVVDEPSSSSGQVVGDAVDLARRLVAGELTVWLATRWNVRGELAQATDGGGDVAVAAAIIGGPSSPRRTIRSSASGSNSAATSSGSRRSAWWA